MDGRLYINRKWTGKDLEEMDVVNPATGQVVGTVPKAGRQEAKQAIDAAHQALPEWSRKTAFERAKYLKNVFDLMMDQRDNMAKLMTTEMGKPLNESKGEVEYAANFLEWFAEQGKRVYGETIPANDPNKRIRVLKQPVGVAGAITPWNFPAAMITRKMGPALAAGCPIVIKPASSTPFTAIMIAEMCHEAGIPAGVVNVITGSASQIAAEMMENEKVRKVTFTGSTEIGKQLMKQASNQLKKLSLELGGHAPMIVLDDADLEKAVDGVLASKFRNAGQTCICGNRIYVQEGIYDDFIGRFKEKVEALKVGNGLFDNVDIGPLIDKEAYNKVDEHVQDALKSGAKLVSGGSGDVNEGYFYQPTILSDVNESMLVMNEETFGPVAPIQKFQHDDEAIELANHSPYGLSAYFFTESVTRGTNIMEGLEYGIVGWNDGLPSAVQAPFGGMKESGIGREGGHEGIEEFLETKYVSIGL